MASYSINERGVERARQLIDARRYVLVACRRPFSSSAAKKQFSAVFRRQKAL